MRADRKISTAAHEYDVTIWIARRRGPADFVTVKVESTSASQAVLDVWRSAKDDPRSLIEASADGALFIGQIVAACERIGVGDVMSVDLYMKPAGLDEDVRTYVLDPPGPSSTYGVTLQLATAAFAAAWMKLPADVRRRGTRACLGDGTIGLDGTIARRPRARGRKRTK